MSCFLLGGVQFWFCNRITGIAERVSKTAAGNLAWWPVFFSATFVQCFSATSSQAAADSLV